MVLLFFSANIINIIVKINLSAAISHLLLHEPLYFTTCFTTVFLIKIMQSRLYHKRNRISTLFFNSFRTAITSYPPAVLLQFARDDYTLPHGHFDREHPF